ncbi:MAG: hypothetical protein RIB59_15590 [Rhodospirillales bacterium]
MLILRRIGLRKRLCAVLALLVLVFGAFGVFGLSGGRAAAADYIAGLDELPLMQGLSENMDKRVVFDTPAGRIVEAYASGPVSASAVTAFYRATLPQLGWRQSRAPGEDKLAYEREGEQLIIDFPEGRSVGGNGATLTVRFTVRPREAADGVSNNTP